MITEFKRAKAFNPGTFLLLLYQGPINKYINTGVEQKRIRKELLGLFIFPQKENTTTSENATVEQTYMLVVS